MARDSMGDTAFRKLINALFNEQMSARSPERREPEAINEVMQAIYARSSGWKELSDERMLPTNVSNVVQFEEKRYLMRLRPLGKDGHLVPWLSISYRHRDRDNAKFEDACCRIYVLMLGQYDGKLVGAGFRIESPEKNCSEGDNSSDDLGRHDFYHAQLIKSIRTHGPEFDTPPWLPCNQPSFPLWATNPVDALLNLILTLYGATDYRKFLKEHGATIGGTMSNEFKKLNERLKPKD